MSGAWSGRLMPVLSIGTALAAWELMVRLGEIPSYTLPAPSLVLTTLWANFGSLAGSWWFTLKVTFGAVLILCVRISLNFYFSIFIFFCTSRN